MGRTHPPLKQACAETRPTTRKALRTDTNASVGVWGLLGIMWVLSLVAIIIDKFTPADLGGLAFVAWIVFLGVIALGLFAAFRGD